MENKIKIIKSNKSWIESNAVEQLKKTAQLQGVVRAVGLPDLHAGKTPVGATIITKDIIYPHLVGSDIGCGISLFNTKIKKKKFKLEREKKKLINIDGIENVTVEEFIEGNIPFIDKLGTIGGGNHFGEFGVIDKVFNEEELNLLGIDKNSITLMVHSGSRAYGGNIIETFTQKYNCQKGLVKGNKSFDEYMEAHNEAQSWAVKNRELIAYRLLNAVGYDKEYNKVLDSTHNSITSYNIEEEEYYIHRKGASPSDVGAVIVAGSRGTLSYIVKPIKNSFDNAYSLAHGAGRKWARFGCKEKLEIRYSKKGLKQKDLFANVICKDKKLLYEEAPECYKNIDIVIQDMLDEEMIELIATVKPLLTYKV